MRKILTLIVAAATLGPAPAWAQDIAGIEDCTRTNGLDRRTGCLQSNVNVLQRLVTRNALEAQQKLAAAGNEIAALKAALAAVQARLEALQAAAEKKPESK